MGLVYLYNNLCVNEFGIKSLLTPSKHLEYPTAKKLVNSGIDKVVVL